MHGLMLDSSIDAPQPIQNATAGLAFLPSTPAVVFKAELTARGIETAFNGSVDKTSQAIGEIRSSQMDASLRASHLPSAAMVAMKPSS